MIMAVVLMAVSACEQERNAEHTKSGLQLADFEAMHQGDSIGLYVLTNRQGGEVCITNYGGRIVSLLVPDSEGAWQDVVLGLPHIDDYLAMPSSFGATVGRVANRIADGQFVLDEDTLHLDINSTPHTIHGGAQGWQNQVFDAFQSSDSTLMLSYRSPDGEGGFPGNVTVQVTFTFREDHALHIAYEASTDQRTVLNMTNHSFFNLSGDPSRTIEDHVLYVNASTITPLDERLITTGAYMPVDNSPFDFREPVAIGTRLAGYPDHAQLQIAQGIDHNFVLSTDGDVAKLAAQLYAPTTGIVMDVYTNEPGLQVYTGNMLDGSRKGKNGIPYKERAAVCLESQHFPDAPNKPDWPSIVLEPGETYRSTCIYHFGVR